MNKTATIISFIIVCILINTGSGFAQEYKYYSPNSKIELLINTDNGFTWSVNYLGEQLILPSTMRMEFATRTIPGEDFRIKSYDTRMVDNTYHPVVSSKNSEIRDRHNDLTVVFRKNFSIRFRIYNDGIAYRFITDYKENMLVMNEYSEINFLPGSKAWYPLEDGFFSHNERLYKETLLDTLSDKYLASLPLLVESGDINLLLSETDLEDYPGMWIRGRKQAGLSAVFPKYPAEEKLSGDRDLKVIETTDFIAETSGKREYPWRLIVITEEDGKLIESNLTWLLSDTCRLEDTDWIKPGKVAWDWWNANNIYDVDFKAGINTQTYKYYIDFASDYGIEYIILDEGWYKLGNLLSLADNMDVKAICDYAREKNVGVILWVVWETLDRQLSQALAQFSAWGVKGIKVDFMQRDDQKMVEYYYRVAKAAAEYNMLVDFHGAYKPSGLRRTYPNIITREGVKGLENSKWSSDITPDHDLTIPFIRMVAGPMDYTPGAMINLGKNNFKPMYSRPASQGTRAHQVAMYVAYESPLQMMADSPSNYRKEDECTRFIAGIPVVWDETKVLEAKVGDYLLIARRSGEDWYIGGMCDWDKREFLTPLSFIGEGTYEVTILKDGMNADRYASDYLIEKRTLSSSDTLSIDMAPGGGWAARLVRK